MIKASALYIVVIVSLLIAIISASVLTIAFYYRQEVQKKVRQDKLLANLRSGSEILLSNGFETYDKELNLDLFAEQKDSVILKKEYWGVFELGIVKAFELKDTLARSFFTGSTFSDQSAIYLADEDRPLSVSGKTQITGDGEFPKSGLKQSYVDGKPYEGKELIKGKIKESTRDIPPLNGKLIQKIESTFTELNGLDLNVKDSVNNSFFNPVLFFKLKKEQQFPGLKKVQGKVILVSDTTLIIDAGMTIEDAQIYAPAIIVRSGFNGTCQLFARDSIIIEKECKFNYPSFAGVFKPENGKIQSKITVGENVSFSGILMSYENKRSDLQTMISLGKGNMITGEVFATGYIKMEKGVSVYGKVYAKRFIMQTPTTLYENYLIDITLNRKLLSKYYLSSPVFQRGNEEQKILKWLD